MTIIEIVIYKITTMKRLCQMDRQLCDARLLISKVLIPISNYYHDPIIAKSK